MNPGQASFYVTGGTLRGDASCYVPRQADADLYDGLKRGEFCYVLTSRQMGKSSLMVRTAQRLRDEGVHVAVLDLTAIGQNLTAEQWYDGLLGHLGRQLRLEDELEDFWQAHERLAPLQRFMRAVREVVLPRCKGQLVIFVDEIDAVHSLPFSTDEFFAAIRECYNRRSEDAELSRLTFCLLGVATPSDLIRDARTTPFNIGRRIELADFGAAEAAPLARGLGRDERLSARLLKRVLYWTGGHPYLTQRLCLTVAQDATVTGPAGVDRVCEELFLSHRARERDDNLLFVRERILRSDVDRAGLLDLYHQVRRGRRVHDEEHSALAGVLRLSGIARVVEGYLWVRNRIYYRVFDREWVQANMPGAEKRRQRRAYRRGLLRASAVAAVLFAMAGAGLFWYLDGYVWDRVSYYNTFVKRLGMYEGVGPLSRTAVAARASSFRFHRKGRYGPVVRMEAVNSRRELNPRHNMGTYLRSSDENTTPVLWRECQWELVLDNRGQVVQEKAMDKLGRLVWAFIYTRLPGVPVRGHFVGPSGYLQDQRRSAAEYVEIEYTPAGFERIRRYFDGRGERRTGPDNAYGVEQECDERGLVVKVASLDDKDRWMIDAAGNTGMLIEHDALGNITRDRSFGPDGRPKAVNDGHTVAEARYDKHGNLTEEAYFDENGRPKTIASGFARVTYQYDDHGNPIEVAYFDAERRPAQHNEGYARVKAKFDDHGNRLEAAYFDRDSRPVKSVERCASFRMGYDERGNITELAFFDEAGRPTLHRDGFARSTYRYDVRGNIIEQAYFDGSRVLTRIAEGYARYTAAYNVHGNLTEQTYFDETGKAVLLKEGYAKFKARFDERGNRVEMAYFDREGRPVKVQAGYAGYTARFDERGNQIEATCFDEEGKPTHCRDGYVREARSFDDRGRQVEAFYSGFEVGKLGYSQRRHKLDDRGRVIEVVNLDASGEPAHDRDGLARWTIRYDDDGHEIARTFFDKEGKPARLGDGYTAWERRYNQGKVVEELFLGYDARRGFARMLVTMKDGGSIAECTYLDAAGKPTKNGYGFARKTRKLEGDKPIEDTYWDLDPAYGFAKMVVQLDDRGLESEYTYLDAAGKPTRHKDGFTKRVKKYDERGKPVEESYSGYDGKDGFAKVVVKLDDNGFDAERVFFDASDRPCPHRNGYFKMTRLYDARGHLVEEAYFDRAGRPMKLENGCARFTARFDERGNEIERAFFDGTGKAVRIADSNTGWTRRYDASNRVSEEIQWGFDIAKRGYLQRKWTYDDRGRIIEVANLGTLGELMRDRDGLARWTIRYDGEGHEIERAFFDVDGKPAAYRGEHTGWRKTYERGKAVEMEKFGYGASHGFAKEVTRYNEAGLWVKVSYLDEAGKPARHKNGFSGKAMRYDEKGKPSEETFSGYDGSHRFVTMVVKLNDKGLAVENTYFDVAGNPVRHSAGNTKWTRAYDSAGKRVEEAYSGYDGSNGFAKMVVKVNEQGLGVENTYFDAAGKPVRHKEGYSKWTRVYDKAGKRVEEIFWGYDGSNGFSRMVVKLNKGLRVEYIYLDEAGKPARHVEGYIKLTTRYDESGKPIENTYWGYDQARVGFAKMIAQRDSRGWETEYTFLDAKDQPSRHKGGYTRKINIYDDHGALVDARFLDLAPLSVRPMVMRIAPDGPGAKLGLAEGDVLLRYDGREAPNSVHFTALRKAEKGGGPPRELVVRRGVQVLSFQVRSGLLGVSLDDQVVKEDPSHPSATAETATTGR